MEFYCCSSWCTLSAGWWIISKRKCIIYVNIVLHILSCTSNYTYYRLQIDLQRASDWYILQKSDQHDISKNSNVSHVLYAESAERIPYTVKVNYIQVCRKLLSNRVAIYYKGTRERAREQEHRDEKETGALYIVPCLCIVLIPCFWLSQAPYIPIYTCIYIYIHIYNRALDTLSVRDRLLAGDRADFIAFFKGS